MLTNFIISFPVHFLSTPIKSSLWLSQTFYDFKLSAGNGFWNSLQVADKKLYQQTIKVERTLLELKRYECNLTFLMKCRDASVYPKFVKILKYAKVFELIQILMLPLPIF